MKALHTCLWLACTLTACVSTAGTGSIELAVGLDGDGTVLIGDDGEPVYPAYLASCGDKMTGFRFGRHSITARPANYLWAWSLPVNEREESARQSGFEPVGSLEWEFSHSPMAWSFSEKVTLDRRIVDVVEAFQGQYLVLQETPGGESVIEAWDYRSACGLPGCSEGSESNSIRSEWLRVDLHGRPEAISTASRGRFIFLSTRNLKTQHVVLHQFDLEGGKHSILETSHNLRMLAACEDLSVRELAGSDGFLLRAYGLGELKNASGRVVERLPKGVNLIDSDGDGVMDGKPTVGGAASWKRGEGRKLDK